MRQEQLDKCLTVLDSTIQRVDHMECINYDDAALTQSIHLKSITIASGSNTLYQVR